MIAMQFGLAASASLNWAIIFSGAQAENCDLSSTPSASAACFAPVWRASVAPSPGLPPICMYMTSPLPIGSSADAAPAAAATAQAAAPARRNLDRRIRFLPMIWSASPRSLPIRRRGRRMSLSSPFSRGAPGAGEAGCDEAGLDHADDETAEHGADEGRLTAEDRGAANEHGGDCGQQIALALVAEEILVLERQHDRGAGGEEAHEGEDLDLLAVDVDADDPGDVIRIADE